LTAHKPRLLRLVPAFALIYLIWGSTFLAIRFAVQTLPPLLMMGTRQLAAGLLLLAWLRARGHKLPPARFWGPAFVAGAFLFLGCHGLLGWAELRVSSGLAALLAATLPIWMVLLAHWKGQDSHLSARVLCGIVMGIVGVGILVPIDYTGARMETLSALAIVVGEMLWAVGAIYARGVRTPGVPAVFASMQMIAGGVLLLAVGLGMGEGSRVTAAAFTARAVVSLAFLIVFGSLVAFTVYTWMLQVCSAAAVSTHSYINPIVAVFLGWAAAGEHVGARTLAGTAIILGSVALVSLRKR